MSQTSLQDRWALVTGASSGIGESIARELAARGARLVLVARRRERLDALAERLRAEHGSEVAVEVCDLEVEGAARALHAAMTGRPIHVLVNNAGFAAHGDFLALDLDRVRSMLQVNAVVPLELAHLFGRDMAARGEGHLVFVSSTSGIVPTPSYSAYSGTKALLNHFGSGLEWELEGSGVRCLVVCPGATATEFGERAGQSENLYLRLATMDADSVARITVRALLSGKTRVVAGWRNWWTMTLVKPLPRRFVGYCVWKLMGQGRRRTRG